MGSNASKNTCTSWEKFFAHDSGHQRRCSMGFLDDLKGLHKKLVDANQSELAREAGMKQQTINRLAKEGLDSVTARNLAKLVDKLEFKLVEKGKGHRSEEEITREILQRVFDACAAAPIDDASRVRILAAVKGQKIAESGHIHRAVGDN